MARDGYGWVSVMDRGKDWHERVAELFEQVGELSAADRRAYYAQHDVARDIAAEIEELLGTDSAQVFGEERLGEAAQRLTGTDDDVSWQPGDRFGDYEIVREIARGGMGVVFEAKQTSLGRRVAIKVVRGARFADSNERQRFRSEAEAIARLEHDGIVPVIEVGEHENEQFFSMAFLAGGSLADAETPMPPRRAAELVAQICDAIHYAHTQNIVHRDLKPANVLLSETMQPKVSDFGIAKDVGEDSDELTRTGAILGTPGFMAPEQASGRADGVGHPVDVYGLGGILFYLLTGRAPIVGDNLIDTLHRVVHDDVPEVRRLAPETPADLSSIARKALERDPLARYGSAAAMATDLRRFLAGEQTQARPLGSSERVARWCRRHPAVAALCLLTILAIAGGVATSMRYAYVANEKAEELARRNGELAIARDQAYSARGDAQAFVTFLVEDVIRSARPLGDDKGLGTDTTVREALVATLDRIGQRFEGRPLAEAIARHEIGITLRHVNEWDRAIDQLRIAYEIRERELGPTHELTLATLNSYGVSCWQTYKNKEALRVFELLVERTDASHPGYVRYLRNLAANYERVKRYPAMLATLERALPLTTGKELPGTLASLATAQLHADEPERARRTMSAARSALADHELAPAKRLDVEFALVDCHQMLGEHDVLARVLPGMLERCRKIFSPHDTATRNATKMLADALLVLDRREAAPRGAAGSGRRLRRSQGAGHGPDPCTARPRRQCAHAVELRTQRIGGSTRPRTVPRLRSPPADAVPHTDDDREGDGGNRPRARSTRLVARGPATSRATRPAQQVDPRAAAELPPPRQRQPIAIPRSALQLAERQVVPARHAEVDRGRLQFHDHGLGEHLEAAVGRRCGNGEDVATRDPLDHVGAHLQLATGVADHAEVSRQRRTVPVGVRETEHEQR